MGATGADIESRIERARILPVVVIEQAADAVPLAKALLAGGLGVAEITFRTAAASEALSRIRDEVPNMLLGAGTVLTQSHLLAARDAGAQFIVTPGFNPAIVEASQSAGLPIVPGVNNPTGVEQAMSLGLKTVKFFPAEPSGGVPFIKALSGPYPEIRFVPTGGIGPGNLANYLALQAVVACGGSWMVDTKLVRDGRFDEITRLTAEAVALAGSAR
ncbi:bifunctional 4-hydroxy-2-oxoglutarate aldolase/2-dehydro-3-deoxy-phosphogluconate aldolase [Rhizobium sp. RHZ02]|uniref:bifunctional 4-hydroxy-2-oxoglutarate aldolase/2-dehydro-3-deoxy-phosphogluconate aldolase n=1 Tax=Rhizobium sp. RHZ02 TaxID=2769306 RepID=UPI001780C75C|nr:bifunctional 4-hydroxy-2-oxoglutarate aldolase/2-dehydro-3-deoxy-phosphogluconate aldolase [Rhizobium sp. RHZ02]MBD9454996.1 bifunctional 4-hydroxy-2-oxoglutarate aldolase/2-dehydro-3-deoxy-phosphogluconate aldolase [Rhizobium sp. RHZ02]